MRTLKTLLIAVVALALLAARRGHGRQLPARRQPRQGQEEAPGKAKTFTVCKQKKCKYKSINKAIEKAQRRRPDPRQEGHLQARA